MIRLEIPQRGTIELVHAVFDINGTLAIDGVPLPGVAECMKRVAELLSISILTAGTHGNLEAIEQILGFPLRRISTGEDKAHYVRELGPESVIAIGNGANDAPMLRLAAIGIAVLSGEGMAISALQAADVVTLGPLDAIELLLHPKRLISTLRG
jgi:soluble P-type ATPase